MADKVTLKPYPFPEGIAIPKLMPFQEYPWNGDGYLAAEVLRLKESHNLTHALETGTCLGSTTLWISETFDRVWTCEVNESFYSIASARFTMHQEPHCLDKTDSFWENIVARRRHSPKAVYGDADRVDFIFLDAHWGEHCPLLDELDAIASPQAHHSMGKPCIIIHDFQVPGTDFGFDRFPDTKEPFSLAVISPYLDRIYGEGGWKHNYPTRVEGAERGWISIEPA